MRHGVALALAPLVLAALLACGAALPRGPGESLHVAKCGACHLRPAPERFDATGWARLLDEHRERVPLEPSERADLLAWLSGTAEDEALKAPGRP